MKNLAKCLTQIVVALFFIFSITSCNKKAEKTTETLVEPTFNLATAKGEIVDANKEFSVLFAANDSIGLSKLYTQDAKFMNNGAPAVTGRKNILSAISGIMNSGVTNINLTTIDVWGMDNLLTEEGEVSLFVEDAEVYKGKYIVLWKKVDGKWKLFRDIFNSNLPAE